MKRSIVPRVSLHILVYISTMHQSGSEGQPLWLGLMLERLLETAPTKLLKIISHPCSFYEKPCSLYRRWQIICCPPSYVYIYLYIDIDIYLQIDIYRREDSKISTIGIKSKVFKKSCQAGEFIFSSLVHHFQFILVHIYIYIYDIYIVGVVNIFLLYIYIYISTE